MNDKTNSSFNELSSKVSGNCRSFPIYIDYHGQWHHEGRPINRQRLVKLFSSVLKLDDEGRYWLETPVEKGLIKVEDVPFVIGEAIISDDPSTMGYDVELITNLGDSVTLDARHQIQMKNGVPYVEVRDNLQARILRPVFYSLTELVDETSLKKKNVQGFYSKGIFQPLE